MRACIYAIFQPPRTERAGRFSWRSSFRFGVLCRTRSGHSCSAVVVPMFVVAAARPACAGNPLRRGSFRPQRNSSSAKPRSQYARPAEAVPHARTSPLNARHYSYRYSHGSESSPVHRPRWRGRRRPGPKRRRARRCFRPRRGRLRPGPPRRQRRSRPCFRRPRKRRRCSPVKTRRENEKGSNNSGETLTCHHYLGGKE